MMSTAAPGKSGTSGTHFNMAKWMPLAYPSMGLYPAHTHSVNLQPNMTHLPKRFLCAFLLALNADIKATEALDSNAMFLTPINSAFPRQSRWS